MGGRRRQLRGQIARRRAAAHADAARRRATPYLVSNPLHAGRLDHAAHKTTLRGDRHRRLRDQPPSRRRRRRRPRVQRATDEHGGRNRCARPATVTRSRSAATRSSRTGPAARGRLVGARLGRLRRSSRSAAREGRVEIRADGRRPRRRVQGFANRFTSTPERPLVVPPVPEPQTTPTEPQGSSGVAGVVAANRPTARLSIRKSVSPVVARPGQRVRYTIVVVNRGPTRRRRSAASSRRQAPSMSSRAARAAAATRAGGRESRLPRRPPRRRQTGRRDGDRAC